ncbi:MULTISPECIES: phosphotransferase [Sulfurimonas]|uniref:phosphotransferase n=1 Tax=Sulfurimonas TaxID=202746 RepID=UPI0012647A0B|nr:phosphotransferase [Sulfurimonas indica]
MGIKTPLTLTQAQHLFPSFKFTELLETQDGIMDTTYIVHNHKEAYILKKYERDIKEKILFDTELLQKLNAAGLNVPLLLAQNKEWYLYKKLKGEQPKKIQLIHLQTLGRFLARFHQHSRHIKNQKLFIKNYSLKKVLREIKTKHYFYYKRLSCLTSLTQVCEGFIHGDIFKDNTLFDGNKIAVFDFIDGGCGSFAFELGVSLLSFNPHARKSYTTLLLSTYNQTAPKKITLREIEREIQNAAKLYALLRISHHSNTNKAKELAKLW